MSSTYKKIVVFDVNLDLNCYIQDDRRYRDLPLVYPLIKQASKYQTVVIQTTGCLSDALNFLSDHDINKGYLIASGGAIIYNIAKKEIIDIKTIDPEDVKSIVHHGIMNTVNIALYTPSHKYLFVTNDISFNAIKNNCYSQYEVISSYDMLQEIIDSNEIVDVGYYLFLGSVDNQKEKLLVQRVNKFWENEVCDLVVKVNRTSHFVHIGLKDSTKLKAIQKVMFIENISHLSDVLYVAASCVNNECYITFNNSLITSNSDFINEIGNKKQHVYLEEGIKKLDSQFGLESNSFWK